MREEDTLGPLGSMYREGLIDLEVTQGYGRSDRRSSSH